MKEHSKYLVFFSDCTFTFSNFLPRVTKYFWSAGLFVTVGVFRDEKIHALAKTLQNLRLRKFNLIITVG